MSNNTEEELLENKHYRKYTKQKLKLRMKYDSTLFNIGRDGTRNTIATPKDREDYQMYINELMDIILKSNSHYQKFIWSTVSVSEAISREKKANPKPHGHCKSL
jgi:predicted lactoylglutathione lyase